MIRRCTILVLGAMLLVTADARAQAGGAFVGILFGQQGEGALPLDVVAALAKFLPNEASTFPLGSSSGGFTWSFDSTLGVQTRRSNSFGPMFAERPLTTGRNKLNVAVAFQRTEFDSLAGQPLNGLRTTNATVTNLVQTYNSSLKFTADRTIIAASYGVHDKVDVGVVIPIDRRAVSGNSSYNLIFRGNPVAAGQCVILTSGRRLCPFASTLSGISTGVGDIIVRGKVALPSAGALDLGVDLDARLPTGDADQLLGLGKSQTRVMLMGSSTLGVVAPHFNVGYTVGGKGIPFTSSGQLDIYDANGDLNEAKFSAIEPSDEVNYTFGVDIAASSFLTLAGDVIGRALKHSVKFSTVTNSSGTFFDLAPATVNLVLGTVGAKVKVGGMWLITGSVVFPLNDAGVKPGVTPVIGFERAF